MGIHQIAVPAYPTEAVRLEPSFDSQRLIEELSKVTGHSWGKQRIHINGGVGAEADLDWRVLALRSPGGDPHRVDPGGPGPDNFASTVWLDRLPYLAKILDAIPAPLNAARLMALGPGAVSVEHCDPKYSLQRGLVRLHIPIVTNPSAVLVLNGVTHRWQPGELWFGDFSRPHLVRNHGTRTRVHLVIDALLTRELADLFPAAWRNGMEAGGALFNRLSVPEPPGPRVCSVGVPVSFTDFTITAGQDSAFAPDEVSMPAQVTGAGDEWRLTDARGRAFSLIHLGGAEFRFDGWSEQRTIQLRPAEAVLRIRTSSTMRQMYIPLTNHPY